MHHFRRRSHQLAHYLSALLWIMMLFLVWFTLGLLASSFVMGNQNLAISGLFCLGLVLVTALVQRIAASCTGCPLCRMPPIASSGCQKSVKVKPLFGSHRTRVALTTLIFNQFRCPYCGEPTRCTVKSKPTAPPPRPVDPVDPLKVFR